MRTELLAVVVPDACCALLCATAAVVDLRQYRIPNWLTATGAGLGLALNLALPLAVLGTDAVGRGIGYAAVGGVFLLAVALPMGALRLLGYGDVKLLAAVGLLIRWPLALHALLYTAIAGGLVALVLAGKRGVAGEVARNVARRRDVSEDNPRHRMPYGVAIFLGVAWAIAARYASALRLIG